MTELNVEEQGNTQVLNIMEKYIRAEADNIAFMVKEHPRGRQALRYLADKTVAMIAEFFNNDNLPEINEITKEQLEASISGFWMSRGIKKQVIRGK